MRSAIPLAAASSASRWHRRTYVLLPVTGGDLAHGLRVRGFAWGNGCNIRRGLAKELLDARRAEEQQDARRVGIHREAVRDSARAVHEGPRAHIDILIAEPEPNLAFKHDEEFVIVAVDMDGRSEAFRAPELDGRELTAGLFGSSFDDKAPAADERSVRLACVGVEHVSIGLVSRKRHVRPLLPGEMAPARRQTGVSAIHQSSARGIPFSRRCRELEYEARNASLLWTNI